MAQKQWPQFPNELTAINGDLAVQRVDDQVSYFHRHLPIFSHSVTDLNTFRLISSQFCVNGSAKQVEIVRTFKVSGISVKRYVKRYRESGSGGFYAPRRRRGAAVLTAPVLSEAQALLDEGMTVVEVAERLELKANTLAKAVRAGRLHQGKKKAWRTLMSRQRSTPRACVAPKTVWPRWAWGPPTARTGWPPARAKVVRWRYILSLPRMCRMAAYCSPYRRCW